MASRLIGIERMRSVGPQVYDSLRRAILSLALVPGEALSEKALSDEMGVSRTPVREALARLAQENLVVIIPQVGTFVSKIDLGRVAEAQFVRTALECAAIADTMDAEPHDLVLLRQNIAKQRDLDEARGWDGIYELDHQFHSHLTVISNHPMVDELVRVPLMHMERVRRLSIPYAGRIESLLDLPSIIDQHERIADAIASRDQAGAVDAMREHLSHVQDVAAALALIMPNYFDGQ